MSELTLARNVLREVGKTIEFWNLDGTFRLTHAGFGLARPFYKLLGMEYKIDQTQRMIDQQTTKNFLRTMEKLNQL